jgi:hypothetical protein
VVGCVRKPGPALCRLGDVGWDSMQPHGVATCQHSRVITVTATTMIQPKPTGSMT